MYVKLLGLYHMNEKDPKYASYYRKQGNYCFDFVSNKDLASDLTQDEVDNILQYKRHYCNMYGAASMVVER